MVFQCQNAAFCCVLAFWMNHSHCQTCTVSPAGMASYLNILFLYKLEGVILHALFSRYILLPLHFYTNILRKKTNFPVPMHWLAWTFGKDGLKNGITCFSSMNALYSESFQSSNRRIKISTSPFWKRMVSFTLYTLLRMINVFVFNNSLINCYLKLYFIPGHV